MGALTSAGLAPEVSAGPAVGAGLRKGFWSAALEGRFQLVRNFAARAGHVSSSLAEGSLLSCARPSVALFCLEFSLSRLSVEGSGVSRPEADSTWIPRIGPRVGVDWALSESLAARAQANALFALSRPRVVLDGETVWNSPALGGLLSFSLLGHFP